MNRPENADPHSPEWLAYMHFRRWQVTPAERFAQKYQVDEATGCWQWNANRNAKGYGRFQYDGWFQSAHRVSYLLFVGPIADGCEVDHVCRNRGCVNPEHLQLLSHTANVRRGATAMKTHCKHGHPLSGANVYSNPKHPQRRGCRTCIAAHTRAWEIRVGRRQPSASYDGKHKRAA